MAGNGMAMHGHGAGMRGHGLGLYIAAYYARKLDISLAVQNSAEGVAAVLAFPIHGGGDL